MAHFETLSNLASVFRDGAIDSHLSEVNELLRIYDDLQKKQKESEWFPFGTMIIDLLESVGLMPYVASNMGQLSLTDILRLMPYEMEEGKFFHHGQIQMLDDLLDEKVEKLAIVAPTSFGKTKLVDYYLKTKKPSKVIIIQPTIALLQETFYRLSSNEFLADYSIFTDQEDFNPELSKWIAIWTQERCFEWLNSQSDKATHIDFFVVDEFYLIDPKRNMPEDSEEEPDDERAEILRYIYKKLAKVSKKTLLIGPVANRVSNDAIKYRESNFTPVRQVIEHEYKKWGKTQDLHIQKVNRLIEIIKDSQNGVLVFRPSPDKAQELAQELIEKDIMQDFDISMEVSQVCLWLEENYKDTVCDWTIHKALKKGIGIHHGKMPRSLQRLILSLFNKGHLHTLIMTPTIVQGVNTTGESLVYWKTTKEGRSVDYFAYKNIIGRAGRLGFHITGTVYLFDAPPSAETISIDIPSFDEDVLDTLDKDESASEPDRLDELRAEVIQDFRSGFPGLKITRIQKAFEILDQHKTLFPMPSVKEFLRNTDKQAIAEILKFCDPKIKSRHLTYKNLITAMNQATNKHIVENSFKGNTDLAYKLFFERLQLLQFNLPKGLSILFRAALHRKLITPEDSERLLKEILVYSRFQTPTAIYALEEQGIPFHISQKIIDSKAKAVVALFDDIKEPKVSEFRKALIDQEVRHAVPLTDTDIFILDKILELPKLFQYSKSQTA